KCHDEGFVCPDTNDGLQELCRRLLLKEKAIANRVTGVYEQTDTKREVGLSLEHDYLLGRLAIVQNSKLILLKVLDELAVLVCHGENEAYLWDGLPIHVDRSCLVSCSHARTRRWWRYRRTILRLGGATHQDAEEEDYAQFHLKISIG